VANFGGAMDCSALALDAPLNVKVTPRLDGHVSIRYFGDHGERVPRDRSNLVVQAMEAALRWRGLEFAGADFEIYSSVPVAVGLGSSTAAVLAGLLAADQLFRLGLDDKALFELAAVFEERQDNVRAAWLGGFVTCTEEESGPIFRRTVIPDDLTLDVVVPEAPMASGPRRVHPSHKPEGTGNSSHQRLATSIAGYFSHPDNGFEIERPNSLPPTCEKQVPGLEDALRVRLPGVLSVFVCGSGPAVGILAQENSDVAVEAVRKCFGERGVKSQGVAFRPTNRGARHWNAVRPDITLPARGGRGLEAPRSFHNPA
jgi:homoserine kinase